jgi:hypothetical protein
MHHISWEGFFTTMNYVDSITILIYKKVIFYLSLTKIRFWSFNIEHFNIQ